MTDLTIKSWFEQAMPEPTIQNFQVQLGCHFEEVTEMLAELRIVGMTRGGLDSTLRDAFHVLNKLSSVLKQGELTVVPLSRERLLDSICDQNVTGIGVAHVLGMDIEGALNEVNQSNWSKFVDGKPIFDNNGKIKKGPNYKEPKLAGFVNQNTAMFK